jgi:hypothetical protein
VAKAPAHSWRHPCSVLLSVPASEAECDIECVCMFRRGPARASFRYTFAAADRCLSIRCLSVPLESLGTLCLSVPLCLSVGKLTGNLPPNDGPPTRRADDPLSIHSAADPTVNAG